MAKSRICSVEGCGKPHSALGWCRQHYIRFRRHGNPLTNKQTDGGAARAYFYRTVLSYSGDECHIWPFCRNGSGYGQINLDGKMRLVSRVVCEMVNGTPPSLKYEAAHSCGNGHLGCVNPDHLSWKTRSGNQMDRAIHGTSNRGERSGKHKLTERQVRYAKAMRGKTPQTVLAKEFGVSPNAIYEIQTGKSWAWLD